MLSERTIINGLLFLSGAILGPYLIIFTLEQNQIALLAFGGLVFLFCVFFFVKDRIAIFPVIGAFFGGSLNFLPLGFTLIEVFSLISILYYLINYVALKRRSITLGPRYFLIPILVLGAIVFYHDQKIGLRILGGGEEGSRPGLFILVAIAAYFCGINIPSPSKVFLSRLPIYCFILSLVSSVPYLLTTYFPSLAPYVYYFSGNINLAAYQQSIGSSSDTTADVARNGALAGIGAGLQMIMVCYYPITTWWHPRRWLLIVLSLGCFYFALSSGFRNSLLGYLMGVLFAAVCYARWRMLFLLPVLALAPLAVIIAQNDHPFGITLPDTVQRSMSFLPGHWDSDVVNSALASNDFRADIKRVYISEYLYKSPWVGNGFTFNPGEADGFEKMLQTGGVSDPQYFLTKEFIVTKNFHVGWISLYDAVGLIGSIAFTVLNLCMVWFAGRFVFEKTADAHSRLFPLKVWVFCNLASGLIGYFTTFGSFNASLIGMCGLLIILVHLNFLEKQDLLTRVSPPAPNRPFPQNRTNILLPSPAQ